MVVTVNMHMKSLLQYLYFPCSDDDMATELEKLSLDTSAPVTDKPPEPKTEATKVRLYCTAQ